MLELSDLPISGYGRIWIDGELHTFRSDPRLNLAGDGFGAALDHPEHDNDYAWVRLHDGRQTAADAYLLKTFSTYPERPWSADMILKGVAYAVITFKGRAKDKVYTGGFPEVRIEIDGAPLYDPRTGTTGFTENPIVMAWNIVRGIQLATGDVWGYDVPAADIVQGPAFAAMNVCDEMVSNGSGTEKRYRAGIEITVDTEPADAVQALLDACSGDFADMGGEIVLSAGPPPPSVYSFTDAEVMRTSDEDFTPFEGLDAIKNAIHAKFPDPNKKWEIRDAVPLYNLAWEAQDGGRRLVADISFPAVPFPRQVRRLMREMAADARKFRNHMIALPPDAGHIRVLDTITWTSSPANGYVSKQFEVRQKAVDPWTGVVIVQIKERDPADYNPNVFLDGELPSVAPGGIVVPEIVGVPGWSVNAVNAGGLPGIKIDWNPNIVCDAIKWKITRVSNGQVVNTGTTTDVKDGTVTLTAGLINKTQYRVVGRRIMNRETKDSVAVLVTTMDLRVTRGQLEQAILDDIAGAIADADRIEGIVAANRTEMLNEVAAVELDVTNARGELTTIRNDLLAESNRAKNEATAIRASIVDVIDDLDEGLLQAQSDLNTARTQLQTQIGNVQTGLRSEMGTAITTGINNYDTVVQGQLSAIAGQIEELTASLTSADLLQNGDFATGDLTYWGGTGTRVVMPKAGASVALVASAPRPFVTRLAAGANLNQDTSSFTLTANDRLRVRFSAASAGTTASSRRITLRATYFDASNMQIGSVVDTIISLSQNAWSVYTHEFDPPDNAVKANVAFITVTGAPDIYITAIESNTADRGLEAEVVTIKAAVTNLDNALATYKTEVNTRFNTTNASVTSEANARSAADSAMSTQITNLTARTTAAESEIETTQETVADLNGSIANLDMRVTSTFGSRQMVRDPEFNEGYTHWSGSMGTTSSLVARNNASSDSIIKSIPGKRALAITDSLSGSRVSPYFDISPAETYDFSVYAARKGVGPSVRVKFHQRDAAGVTLTPHRVLILTPDDGEWSQFNFADLKPYPTAVQGWMMIEKVNGGGTGTTYVTGIEAIRQDADSARSKAEISTLQTAVTNANSALATYKTEVNTRFGNTQSSITAESTARSNADSAINSSITALTGRVGSAETNISSEITSRTNADTALGGRIDSLTTRVGTAETNITSANTARANADSALGSRIDSVTTRVGTAETNISNQQTSLTNLSNSLGSYKTEVNTRFNENEAAISSEATARSNADSAASSLINSVKATAESKNKTYRQSSAPTTGLVAGDVWYDTSNNNSTKRWSGSAWITTDDPRIAQNVADITAEETARANADSAITGTINTLTSRVSTAEAGITSANTARANADSALTSSINSLTTRVGTAETNITAANTARANGDSALTTSLNALTSRVGTAEGKISSQATTLTNQEKAIADVESYVTSTFGNTQLVRDPDFGEDTKYWPSGGMGDIIARNKTTSTSWINTQMPGRKALRVANAEAGNRVGLDFEASAGERYDLGAYMGNSSNGPRLRVYIQWRNEAGTQLGTSSVFGPTTTKSWAFFTATNIQPPAGTTKGRVVVARESDGTGGTAGQSYVTGIEVWRQTAFSVEADASIKSNETAITNANSAIASLKTELKSDFNGVSASGKFNVQTVSNVNGSVSRIALAVATSGTATPAAASIWLEARSDGTSFVTVDASRFVIAESGGTGGRRVPFYVDDGVVYMNMASIKEAAITRLKIGPNQLYVPYLFTRADVEVTTTRDQSNQILLFDRTIPDFEGGGYKVDFNAYYDSTASYDAFGALRLIIDGVQVGRTRFGVRSDTGNSEAMFPISIGGTATGFGSTNIKVYAWNAHWSSLSTTSRPFWLRDLTLTVSGSRR